MAIWSAEIKELEKLFESLKGQLPDLEKELVKLIKADDENMILLYSRRCLEVIITDLCECELKRHRKTEPLKGIIDKLHKEEKVPSHIISSMHGLNELSTYGAHPKDFDPEQIKPVLINLDIIIKWYLRYQGSDGIRMDEPKLIKDSARLTEYLSEEIRKPKNSLTFILTSILLIIAVLLFPKIFKRDKLENLRTADGRISVAVMPFQNMTNDTSRNVWEDWIQGIIITSLSNSPDELKVSSSVSINNLIQNKGLNNYGSITTSVASSISQKLDANVFLYGNIIKSGTTIRVNAQLIDSKSEEVLKSFQIEGTSKDENILPIIDSLSSEVKIFLIISRLKKGVYIDFQRIASSTSPEAYQYFTYGQRAFGNMDFPTAINLFSQAVTIDSNFTYAVLYIAWAYLNQHLYEEGKKWCLRAYEKRDLMPIYQKTFTNFVYSRFFETPNEAIKYLKQLLEIDDQIPHIWFDLGVTYSLLNQYNNAIFSYERSLELYTKIGIKPWWVYNYTDLGYEYHKTGQYKKEKEIYYKAEQDFPDDPELIYGQAILSLSEGDTVEANRYIKKFKSIRKDQSWSEAEIITNIAEIYSEADVLNKAEEYYRESVAIEPENQIRMNNLAYFLIDKDRNIDEGMQLVSKCLELNPDNFGFLHTKGWGLYKQGKYQQALEILQKSWDVRREKAVYNHKAYLHLEAAKKAVAGQKVN